MYDRQSKYLSMLLAASASRQMGLDTTLAAHWLVSAVNKCVK